LGRHDEAESAITETFRIANAEFVPIMALLHWHSGMALAALSQPSKAREHCQRASAIDPHGKYGTLAARWLDDDQQPAR